MTADAFRPLPGDPSGPQIRAMFDARSEDWWLGDTGDYQAAAAETMRADGTDWQRVVILEWPGRLNHSDERRTLRIMLSPEDAVGLSQVLSHAGRWLLHEAGDQPTAEERVAAALELIDYALGQSTEDLEEKLSGLELAYGQGFRDGIRTGLEKVREALR